MNGSGKSTVMNLLDGSLAPAAGVVERGGTSSSRTVPGHRRGPGHLRVLEALEEVRGVGRLGGGEEISAGMLAERFGFRGDRALTLAATCRAASGGGSS